MRAELRDIQPLRAVFLQERNIQIRYNACHERGWSDSYLLESEGARIGYGSVKGKEIPDRDTIFEFFILPPFRELSSRLFLELVAASGVRNVECQSNDPGLAAMLYEFGRDISADTVLFADHAATEHVIPGAVFRRSDEDDQIFEHKDEPPGGFVVEMGGEIVATGGFMLHYNMPFADLYMEVREDRRRRGLASFLLQELKKECYLAGRVPAARTSVANLGSRGALRKAGLRECGYMLTATVASP